MQKIPISEIRKTGIPVSEISEKIGMSPNAVRQRIYHRDIQPIGYIGMVAYYTEDIIEQIKIPLPIGKASPKHHGSKRRIADI
jgi:hypothetical protein